MIYWDHNATTPVADQVLEAMLPFLTGRYMNPSSGYASARAVRDAVEEARSHVAALVGASPDEIIFTSGATESINTAIKGMKAMTPGRPVLCLPTDHSAVLQAVVGERGAYPDPVAFASVDRQGRVLMEDWERETARQPAGASVTWANNETGVILDAASLVETAHRHHLPVHIDAVQCLGKMPIDVAASGAEYASFSAHKLYGPKGVGALYVRAGVRLPVMIFGGDQEQGRRGGTENVPGIVGFGEAARLALAGLEQSAAEMRARRDAFERGLLASLDGIEIIAGETERLPNTSNILFDGCTAEALSLLLEPRGLLCSAGSACKTASPNPSHVLTAMGLDDGEARSCLRFSMGRLTHDAEVEQGIRIVTEAVQRVRSVQSSRTGPVTVYRP